MSSQPTRQDRAWPIASLAAAGCLWGTGFLFGKITFAEMTVSENVGYRFIFGSLGLAPVLWKRFPTSLRWRAWCLLLVASVVGVPIQFLLQYKGLEATTVSHASLIVGTLPVLLALSSAVLLRERLKALEYGLMVASAGGAVKEGRRRPSAHSEWRFTGVSVDVCRDGDDPSYQAPHERIRSFASYCLDDRSRHADAARLDRSDASDALSFFAPRLACRRSSRTSLHHGRIPVVELGIGPSTCGSRGRVLKS